MKIEINPDLQFVNIENSDEIYGTAQQRLEAIDKVYIKSNMQDSLPVIVHQNVSNCLEQAVFMAYSYHRGLVIDPNDWWIMVVQQVTRYISDNGESLREVFVNFEGKKELVAHGMNDSKESWERFMEDMASDIGMNIKFDLPGYLKTDFSTSTPTHKACVNALLMKGMDKFFGYKFITMCGIRYIEMMGVEEDYVKLVSKTQDIMNLPGGIGEKLTPYLNRVKIIFEKFLETFRGNVDKDFWNKIYNYESRGSGSPSITGWVKNMVCYSEEDEFLGERDISEFSNLPSSYSTVEFKWDDNGLEREYMRLSSGLIAVEVIDGGEAYKPVAGWIVYDDFKRCNEQKERDALYNKIKEFAKTNLVFPFYKASKMVTDNEPAPEKKDPKVIDDIEYMMTRFGFTYDKVLDLFSDWENNYHPNEYRGCLDKMAFFALYDMDAINLILQSGIWPYSKAVEIAKENKKNGEVIFDYDVIEKYNKFRNLNLYYRLQETSRGLFDYEEIMEILLNNEEIPPNYEFMERCLDVSNIKPSENEVELGAELFD
jgi:hypothetical protein